jgi:hypothetical protein
MRPISPFSAVILALPAAAALAGCGNPLSLLPANFANRVDTVVVWAATGTAINLPSGYEIAGRTPVRLDQVIFFDFLYDLNADGRRYFLPVGAVVKTGRTNGNPGFLLTPTSFDAITTAQQLGYQTADTIPATVGQVYYVRSTLDPNCALGIPYYAKMEVLGFDDTARSVRFRILSNINCGYRDLEVGIPSK